MIPAIFLIVVGTLGILLSMFNVVYAMVGPEPQMNADTPELVFQMQKGSRGVSAMVIQALFVIVNGVIIFGAVQMLRIRTWGLALTVSILAMINFGSCCCILGLPAGIWSIIILMGKDVQAAFKAP